MSNVQLSNHTANGQADWLAAQAANGYLYIYGGTQPANANTAVTVQPLRAVLRFGATAFGAAVGGVLTANTMIRDESADSGGAATWCRITKSDGTTVLFDGDVGVAGSGADLILTTTDIIAGAPVEASAFTYKVPRNAAEA